jgi:hypothetical protein
MNRNYLRPTDYGDNYDPPSTEPQQRAAWGAIVVILMFAMCVAFFSTSAHAQTAACAWNEDCLQWDRPTARVDGTALASTDVASYIIEMAPQGSSTWTQVGTVNAPTQGWKRSGVKPGEIWQYRVTAVLTTGTKSVPSNVAVGPPTVEPAPNPPVLKTIDTLAYEVNKSTDAIKLAAIGTVALGVNCKPEYDANGLNVVPRNLVKFTSATKPLVVVAKCG